MVFISIFSTTDLLDPPQVKTNGQRRTIDRSRSVCRAIVVIATGYGDNEGGDATDGAVVVLAVA